MRGSIKGAACGGAVDARRPEQPMVGGCEQTSRKLWTVPKPDVCTTLLQLYTPYVHRNCIHNELNSLCNRVMAPVVRPEAWFLKRLKPLTREIGNLAASKCNRLTWAGFVDCYKGAKRRKYNRALKELQDGGLRARHWSTTHFVKPDKNTESKDARAIQGRHACYNICLGSYLKPFEEWLIHATDLSEHLPTYNFPTGRLFAKGLNAVRRGRLLRKKWDELKNPVAKGCDASRYDQHVDAVALEVEHEAYLAAYLYVRELVFLLEKQLSNKGRTSKGLKYQVEGRRMSGDYNTGLGNSLLMVVMFVLFFTDMRDRSFETSEGCYVVGFDGVLYEWDNHWQFLDDGDDSVVLVEKRAEKAFDALLQPYFEKFGFKMTVEDSVEEFEQVEFCQCRPVLVGSGYVMIRKPRKAISGSLSSVYSVHDVKSMRQLMWATGQCELSLGAGVPIMQEYALACIRNGFKLKDKQFDRLRHAESYRYWILPELAEPRPVTTETRYSFERAFGISVSEQLIIEDDLRGWRVNLDGIRHLDEPLDPGAGLIVQYHF